MKRRRTSGARATAIALLIVLGSAVASLLSNLLTAYLPGAMQSDPLASFSVVLGIVFLVSVALIPLDVRIPNSRLRLQNRRLRTLRIGLRVIQALLVAFAGILSGAAWTSLTSNLPTLFGAAWLRVVGPWLATLVVVVIVVLPFVYERLEGRIRTTKSDREAFRNELSIRYDNLLRDPVYFSAHATLDVADTPVALVQPELTGNAPLVPMWRVSPEQTLRALYEEVGGQLLILGDPGSGKSTQLIELGRDLVEQAKSDLTVPLPVVLDLTTWTANRDPLGRWLVDAIVETYHAPEVVAKALVNVPADRPPKIAPLLDLNGMSDDDRSRCVVELNRFHRGHPTAPLIVCCRSEDYARVREALEVRRAVTLLPLTDEAIDAALTDGGARLERLRTVVAKDAALRSALRTPFILWLAVRTYGDLRGDEIPPVTDLEAWRKQLFGRYVRKMLQRRSEPERPDEGEEPEDPPDTEGGESHYTEEELAKALAWLGDALRTRDRNVFYLERLQEDWLPDTTARRRYRLLTYLALLDPSKSIQPVAGTRWSWSGALEMQRELLGVLVGMLLGGAIEAPWMALLLFLGIAAICALGGVLRSVLIAILIILVVITLLALLIGLLIGGVRGQHIDEEDLTGVNEGIRRSARSAVLCGVGLGVGTGVASGLLVGVAGQLIDWQVSGPDLGRLIVIVGRMLHAALSQSAAQGAGDTLVNWLFGLLLAGLLLLLLYGVFLLVLGLVAIKKTDDLDQSGSKRWIRYLRAELTELSGWYAAPVVAWGTLMTIPSGVILAAILFGALDLHSWLRDRLIGLDPGTLSSTIASGELNGALVVVLFALIGIFLLEGLEGALLGGLVGALAIALSGLLDPIVLVGLLMGLLTGLSFGRRFGGAAVLKHLALLHALQRSGVVPERLEPILAEAADLALLRQVGGGYRFYHALLRDYFAEQYTPRETRATDTALAAKA